MCLIASFSHHVDAQPGDQILYQESQSKQFQNFLLRANRYPSLVFGGEKERGVVSGQSRTRKVVLIEVICHYYRRDTFIISLTYVL